VLFRSGFLVDHAYPTIDIPLPANHAQVIRLRQLGVTDQLFWSIHELELDERSNSAAAAPETKHDPD